MAALAFMAKVRFSFAERDSIAHEIGLISDRRLRAYTLAERRVPTVSISRDIGGGRRMRP